MAFYFPTSAQHLYLVTSEADLHERQPIRLSASEQNQALKDAIANVDLGLESQAVFEGSVFDTQEAFCKTAGKAAFSSFNLYDKAYSFSAELVVECAFDGRALIDSESEEDVALLGNFSEDSTSSGLSYALSLFMTWWQAKQKPMGAMPSHVVATGEISGLGHITPVSAIDDKVNGTIRWLQALSARPAENNSVDETAADVVRNCVFVCHPDNAAQISDEKREILASLGCTVIAAPSLQDALKSLLGKDNYDKDVEKPFLGLASFTGDHVHRFFGRDDKIKEVMDELMANNGRLVLSGPSGAGKSSLLAAGVIPHFKAKYTKAETTYTKGENKDTCHILTPKKIREDITSWWHQHLSDEQEHYLLVVDQSETLFSGAVHDTIPDSNAWLSELDSLISQHPHVNCIISLRDEFTKELCKHPAFSNTKISTLTDALNHQQWEAIIDGQFAYANLRFADEGENQKTKDDDAQNRSETDTSTQPKNKTGLRSKLLEVALEGRRDNLPLFAFLLEQMYEARQDKHTESLSIADYEKVGGLEGVIATQADRAIAQLGIDDPSHLDTVLNKLIWLNDQDNTALSSAATTTQDTTDEEKRIFEALFEARLLKRIQSDAHIKEDERDKHDSTETSNTYTYQFAHEAILSAWPVITKWLDENQAFKLWEQRTTQSALIWQENQQSNKALLSSALDINEARKWQAEKAQAIAKSENELKTFIIQSINRAKQKNITYCFVSITGFIFLTILIVLFFRSINAVQFKEQILLMQSKYLANAANEEIKKGNYDLALLLTLNGIEGEYGGERESSAEIVNSLISALNKTTKQTVFKINYAPNLIEYCSENDFFIITKEEQSLQIYSTENGKEIRDENLKILYESEGAGANFGKCSQNYKRMFYEHSKNKKIQQLVNKKNLGKEIIGIINRGFEHGVVVKEKNNVSLWLLRFNQFLKMVELGSSYNNFKFCKQGFAFIAENDSKKLMLLTLNKNGKIKTSHLSTSFEQSSFNDDCSKLVTKDDNNSVTLWSVRTHHKERTLKLNGSIFPMSTSEDNKLIAVSTDGNKVVIISLETGQLLKTLKHNESITKLQFSNTNDKLITVDVSNYVTIWHLGTRYYTDIERATKIERESLTYDGNELLVNIDSEPLRLWSIASGEIKQQFNFNSSVIQAKMSPTDSSILVVLDNGSIMSISEESKKVLVDNIFDTSNVILDWSSDGKFFLATDGNSKLFTWSAETGYSLNTFEHKEQITHAKFNASGDKLVIVTDKKTINLWDFKGSVLITSIISDDSIIEIDSSSNDAKLAVITDAEKIMSISAETMEVRISDYTGRANDMSFNPVGKTIITSHDDNKATIWSLETLEPIQHLYHHSRVYQANYSENGNKIVTASGDRSAIIWDSKTGKNLMEFDHSEEVIGAIFSIDGEKIITMTRDYQYTTWALDGTEENTLFAGDYYYRLFNDDRKRDLIHTNLIESPQTDDDSVIDLDKHSGTSEIHKLFLKLEKNSDYFHAEEFFLNEIIMDLPINRKCLTPEERKAFYLSELSQRERESRGCA